MIKAGRRPAAPWRAILQRLADFKEKSQSLKRKVKSAMIYPVVVISVAVLIVGFILYYIVPQFKKIFDDFNLPLPQMTQMLITGSDIPRPPLVPDPAGAGGPAGSWSS